MSDYPGDFPYTYGGTTSGGKRTTTTPGGKGQKKSYEKPWYEADMLARDAALVERDAPMIAAFNELKAQKAQADAAAQMAPYKYGGAAEKQWLAQNPAMNITLGADRLATMSALERRRALMEQYGNVAWNLPTNQGWQQGVTGPYGEISGVGLEGDPLQDLPIWKQIAYLPSSAGIRKTLGIYQGPSGYAGDGGGGGGYGTGYISTRGPGGRGGGGGGGGAMGYPKNGIYKDQAFLPRWANSLVAWRT